MFSIEDWQRNNLGWFV